MCGVECLLKLSVEHVGTFARLVEWMKNARCKRSDRCVQDFNKSHPQHHASPSALPLSLAAQLRQHRSLLSDDGTSVPGVPPEQLLEAVRSQALRAVPDHIKAELLGALLRSLQAAS